MTPNTVEARRRSSTVIIGAGPAGLTAAYELARHEMPLVVLEQSDEVGGLARTEEHKGYRFDIGGHRLFTKAREVEALWHEILEDDLLEVPRLSRIYYQGKFYNYPISLGNTLANLGPVESVAIMFSYLKAQIRPHPTEHTMEQWLCNRFGRRLYRTFFKTYTEKVWGIPCTQIRADWAAQRIKGLSMKRALLNALFKSGDETTLINRFYYPVRGAGMMWQRCKDLIEAKGATVRLNTEVVRLCHDGKRVHSLVARTDGSEYVIEGTHVLSSMPITHLIARLDPPPPEAVQQAARGLSYRDFLLIALVVDKADVFPDNWIYIHSPRVKVGRIQNFKNWSAAMVSDASKTCLGMEYFCNRGDNLWSLPDDDLIAMAARELATIDLAPEEAIIEGKVVRQTMAYPVYDGTYSRHVAVIRNYLAGLENLQTVGRAGMHRYNNQDHSMLTAMLAVKNLLGDTHDLWDVNVERSYHEEFRAS